MLEKIKEMIADQMSVDIIEITDETRFKEDLRADSLDLFELVMNIEDEFDCKIPSEDLDKIVKVEDLVNYLSERGVE